MIILTVLITLFSAFILGFSGNVFAQQSCPSIPPNTGVATFTTSTDAGNYRVWIRMKAANSTNNSVFATIGNTCPVLVGDSSQISSSQLTWVDYKNGDPSNKIEVNLPGGAQVVTLNGNEPGVAVDKVLLTKNLSCIPTGVGDNCPAELITQSPMISANSATETTNNSVYVEAENFTLTSQFTKGNDSIASKGVYIYPASGTESTNPVREAYSNIAISTNSSYYIWARIMGPTNASDAMYIGINESWDRIYPNTIEKYEWIKVENTNGSGNYAFNLTAGSHIIQVGHGEINARLDSIFITNDVNAVPNQTSASTPTLTPSLSPTPSLTPTLTPTKTPILTPTPTKVPTPTPTNKTLTINPSADSYVQNSAPTTNFGSVSVIQSDTNPIRTVYLRFNLTPLAGKTIVKANLRLKVNEPSSAVQNLRRADDKAWTETELTYNNRPAFVSTITTFKASPINTLLSINVASVVNLKKGTNLTLGITSSGDDWAGYYSKEAVSGNRPKLIIEYK